MNDRHVVVVGASAAGLATADALRRFGHTGPLTLIGQEAHPPYDRPPLSKQVLSGAWQPGRVALKPAEALAGLGLDLRLGVEAVALDTDAHQVRLGDGSRIGYDDLVVATGAGARRLPGTDGIAGVHVLRTMEDALGLRDALTDTPHLLIVGGGFVGAEAAAVARGLGCRVTMVTDIAAPMGDVLGPDLAGMMAAVHREHGVEMRTGVAVERVLHDGGRATGVRLADGVTLDADVILVGIGARPHVEWLAGSGLTVGNGLECDETLYAGQDVWAAGDVASWLDPRTGVRRRVEHRTNAGEQALAVGRNVLAGRPAATPFTTVPYVWSDQYDLKIQIYGDTRGAQQIRVVEGAPSARRMLALYGRDGVVVAAAGINMVRALRGYRTLVADAASWHGV
ncbi:3-phenylpropionate/trans-cinnamate dioxygenase ferredoxin reductase subunit [Catenuloplanes nepalensis]|uniref:3-phenylpropionate/trans-cinnamate dioxygenase ferredoxin reductase subunit n=1 Tax=Catenuloplanes nepalensis TaxID=587533 RepID=A0ABT9MNU2_9ACTN|nr:FAD-dependent oxidoreductase [Catenuloplanes nepalensis]MDP9792991.1 3-phenylpropionate/trans-cinnamate dioxygenase ferredoxin reductase subunit [Catenuloplanes nepalensis]